MWDFFLFNSIKLVLHHCSIVLIPFYNAILLSAIIAISSAKTITFNPNILLSLTTRSSITRSKKKGLDLFP